MKITTQRSVMVNLLSASLIALLLIGAFGRPAYYSSSPVSSSELSHYRGAGFWNDPCTWDGLLTGIGASFCATGSIGGCASAIYSVWKAIKVDNCF